MAKDHLSHEEFFVRLSELFNSRRDKGHGSIFLTQKRFTYGTSPPSTPSPDQSAPFADLHLSAPVPLLIRATDGKSGSTENKKQKIKLSTVVEPDGLDAFYAQYAELCKTGMQALKKRDRSGRKKAKAKKRKAGGAEVEASEKKK